MALLAPFDRPLALRLLSEVERPRTVGSPPVPPLAEPVEQPRDAPPAGASSAEIARFLAYVLLTDTPAVAPVIAELAERVAEDVVVWSPCVSTQSKAELVAALLDGDDALTDVVVSILGTSTSDDTVHLEWRLQGRFNNAGFVNDDLLVEPSGALVDATGALVVEFDGERATHIRCYYDSLGLLEQVIEPERP